MVQISIRSDINKDIITDLFGASPDIGAQTTLSDDTRITLVQGDEQGMLGTASLMLLAKFSALASPMAQGVIGGIIANTLYDLLKKAGSAVLKIDNKPVKIDPEAIKQALKEALEEKG